MKFTLALALLAPVIAALPAADVENTEVEATSQNIHALNCGDNLCVGINKNELCNDRVCP